MDRTHRIIGKIDRALRRDANRSGKSFINSKPHGYSCHWCGREMLVGDKMRHPTRDHVLPRSGPGKGVMRNVVWACYACNNLKGNMHPEFWKCVMRDIPEWWRLADMKGPRGVNLVEAMKDCGFSFNPMHNGQPYEEWWHNRTA